MITIIYSFIGRINPIRQTIANNNEKKWGQIGLLLLIFPFLFLQHANALGEKQYVTVTEEEGSFALSVEGHSAPLYIASQDFPGVIRALGNLQTDIEKVTGYKPGLSVDSVPKSKNVVIVGTIGKSPLIDKLVKEDKIDISGIEGKWESYIIRTIENPIAGIDHALLIAGSDKRGTIFGIYDLSQQIGVSPWYWWADVPVEHKDALYINPGLYIQGPPDVKYRGIFLNDEDPDLTQWVKKQYGNIPVSKNPPIPPDIANYNHEFYARIFELILRLKGNYLWPAMWNNAFNEDDPENPKLADECGIVMGTSHQEPMLRAQKEWDRRYEKTLGHWDYKKYPDVLQDFWREGIRRNKDYESIITVGLRGADDTEMAKGGPEANKAMLEDIVNVQRRIISEEMNTEASRVPQLWCLYKEVQDYYIAGMRVPDDVTLLWAEDNWGNVRRLPTASERERSGGAGIYYHFDYHGGPRSYQWINTSPIPKIWDQMTLSKQYGADRIWIVNVGHFRGYEFPLEYFMNLAWNTDRWTNNNINEYTELWAKREFGPRYAKEIAEIISKYTKYNGRRKPELLSPETYSLVNYNEAENVVADYNAIAKRAEEIYTVLPEEQKNAFYQLVLFPTKACALVNELYLTANKNYIYALQKRASANEMAIKTRELFQEDTNLMNFYNHDYAGGKWDHFMDQTHLGYVSWRDPKKNSLDGIDLKKIKPSGKALMGIAIEGRDSAWLGVKDTMNLPEYDVFTRQKHYVDVFNRGKTPFPFTVSADKPWILINESSGTVAEDKRIWVEINWDKLPKGLNTGTIKITGTKKKAFIKVRAFDPVEISPESLDGFVEGNGYVSIEAEHYTRKTDVDDAHWIRIEDYGHTLSGMRATANTDAPAFTPGKESPCLEYKMYLFSTGKFDITSIFSPTLNFISRRALRYAISVDGEPPRIVTLVPADYNAANKNIDWEESVMNNARFSITHHQVKEDGYHTVKIWMVDPGVVLQKIIVDLGGLKPSYLGPPESFFHAMEN